MEYEVSVDFGDGAIQAPHICKNLTDLGLYLERIPSMMGFELNGKADVTIKQIWTKSRIKYKETQTA